MEIPILGGEVLVPIVVESGGEWRVEMSSFLPSGVTARIAGLDPSGSITVRDSATLSVQFERNEDVWSVGPPGGVLLVAYDADGEYVGDTEVLFDWAESETVIAPERGMVVGPNPAGAECTIGFQTVAGQAFEVSILDVGGRLVRRLASGSGPDAWMRLRWNLRDSAGRMAPPGIYLAKLRVGSATTTRRIVVHK